jgi:hypothetical protein
VAQRLRTREPFLDLTENAIVIFLLALAVFGHRALYDLLKVFVKHSSGMTIVW